MDDEKHFVVAADPKAYRKAIAYDFPNPTPGGRPEDKNLKASPYLIKALKERDWIEKERARGYDREDGR